MQLRIGSANSPDCFYRRAGVLSAKSSLAEYQMDVAGLTARAGSVFAEIDRRSALAIHPTGRRRVRSIPRPGSRLQYDRFHQLERPFEYRSKVPPRGLRLADQRSVLSPLPVRIRHIRSCRQCSATASNYRPPDYEAAVAFQAQRRTALSPPNPG